MPRCDVSFSRSLILRIGQYILKFCVDGSDIIIYFDKIMNMKWIFVFGFMLIGALGFSQLGGNNTYEFLNLPISARVTALGGNLISVRDNDLNVALTNPSLLSDSMNNNVALSFTNYIAGIKYGYVTIGKHFKRGGNFSLGVNYLNYGNLVRADEYGNVTGTFGGNEESFNLAYSHRIIDSNFYVGANLKTIYSVLDVYTSYASALDLGATYYNPKTNFGLAGVIKNIGHVWKGYDKNNQNEKLPFEIQLGTSYRLKKFPIRMSVVYENVEQWDLTYHDPLVPYPRNPVTGEIIEDNKYKVWGDKLMRHIVLGTEFIISKNLFLRVGYNYQRAVELKSPAKTEFAGFSFGFGFRVYKFHFSYGRAVYLMAGVTNNFSVSFDMGSFHKK